MNSEYKLSRYIYIADKKDYIAIYSYINSKIAFCNVKEDIELFRVFLRTGDYYKTNFTQTLINYDMIIDINYDEDMLLSYLFNNYLSKNKTLLVIMIPSELCNFNCKYCYEEKDSNVMSDEILNGSINFIKIIVEENSYKSVQIEWFGGEPTLFENLIIKFLNLLKYILPDIVITSSMTTNGYLLDYDMFNRFLNNGIVRYQITLDCFAETHDKLRVTKDNEKTWDVIYNNLKVIKNIEKDFNIILRINYNELMLDEIFNFLLFIKNELGNKFIIHLHPIINFDETKDFTHEMCDPSISELAKFPLFEFIAENEVISDIPLLYTSFGSQICYAAKPNSFVIDSKGIIRKCTVALNKDYNEVGIIRDRYNFNINLFKLAKWTEINFNNNRCNRCSCLPTCNGTHGCPLKIVSKAKEERGCNININLAEAYIDKIIERVYKNNYV